MSIRPEASLSWGYAGVDGWNGTTWIRVIDASSATNRWINTSALHLSQIRTVLNSSAGINSINVPEVIVSNYPDTDVVLSRTGVRHSSGMTASYEPYTSFQPLWPVQYLLKVEADHIIVVTWGLSQVDPSARTSMAYVGRLGTPVNAPPADAGASTRGNANLTAFLSDNRRASVETAYGVYPSQVPISPDIQNRFALVPLCVYRSDENWRGWFQDLYVCQLPPQAMLSGDTVTSDDGTQYTFFNIPANQDGRYNNFLAANATNQWLVVRR